MLKTKADKTRILWLFLFLMILVVGIVFLLFGLKKSQENKRYAGASVRAAPSVESIPGLEGATEEYVKTQKQENLKKAEQAAQTGTSAIPTITRPALVGNASEFLAQNNNAPPRSGCSPDEVKSARAAGVNASELRCKGCTVKDLHGVFTIAELKDAGFSVSEMKAQGFSIAELRQAGFNAQDLVDAGYSATDLKAAGYTPADLKAADVNADDLRKMGFAAGELRAAGFSIKEMRDTGFSVPELKAAGYNPKELKAAGATFQELNNAGFSSMQLLETGATDADLAGVGVLPDTIKTLKAQLLANQKLPTNCDVGNLTKAKNQGISAAALSALKCDAAALRAAGYSAVQLKAAGFSANDLKGVGFLSADLKNATYKAAELIAAGYKAAELKNAGFTTDELKAAGASAQALNAAGYSADELKKAGFTAAELNQAGYASAGLLKAGFSPKTLRAAGYTVAQMKSAELSPKDLKSAGFTNGEIIRAGFTEEDINKSLANADPVELHQAGYTPAQLKAAGLSPNKLKTGGYKASELLAAGYTAEELKNAGFTDAELLKGGLTPQEIERLRKTAEAAATVSTPVLTSPVSPAVQSLPNTPAPAKKTPNIEELTPADDELTADPEKVLALLRKRQTNQFSKEQQDQMLQQIQASMTTQTNDLFTAWNPPPTQMFVMRDKSDDKDGSAAKKGGAGLGKAEEGSGSRAANTGDIVKAGTIMFAVLDTGVNSDEVSPILATIVQGPFKGARLLGQFNRTDQKVLLSFSTMSLPNYPTSIPVTAVAIDPNTARTAVASSVDNHYLLRYGSLFASSFMAGYATAVAQSGLVTSFPGQGQVVVANPPLAARDKLAIGLGQIGTQWGAAMGQNFTKPPTVKVDSGAGLGILFMADLKMPEGTS